MVRVERVALVFCIMGALLWGGYTLDYSLSNLNFQMLNGYYRISGREFTCVDEPGRPELPSVLLHYIIPAATRVDSLLINELDAFEVPGQFLVYPTQLPVVPGQPAQWIPPDTTIYNSSELYPDKYIEIVNEGIMDGARIVTIVVHPVAYRPSLRKLYILSHIDFDFVFAPNTLPEIRAARRGTYEQELYDDAMMALVMNDNEIDVRYQRPALVPTSQLGQLAPFPTGPGMIICDPSFADAFQPYAEWLTDQGIKTQLISPQLIYLYFEGVDNAYQIRNYIKYCYANAGGTYFILGGDGGSLPKLPYRKCHCYEYFHDWQDTIPCDYYFCALDGNWDGNNNYIWGQMDDDVDQFPEVYVGRIPCGTISEAINWVEKALNYEKTPANTTSMNKVFWIHQNGTWPNQWKMADTTRFPEHYEHTISENNTAYATFNLLNYGYGFTNEQTHGHIDFFPTGYPGGTQWVHVVSSFHPSPPTPASQRVGLNWLSNDNKYYVNYGVGCKTGAFDVYDLCIVDAFVDAYRNSSTDLPVGACASIEHTRASWEGGPMPGPGIYSVKLQNEYYELLFTQEQSDASYSRIGFAEALAKTNMYWSNTINRWVCYATNLFGAPTTAAWTNVPRNINVTHPSRIPVNEQTQFVVAVSDAESHTPVPHAKVCLHKPGDIYKIEKTDEGGDATFLITPNTTGTLKVTVTRFHNDESYTQYLPSQTFCEVLEFPGGGSQASGSENIMPDHICITRLPTLCRNNAVLKFGVPKEGVVDMALYDITGARVNIIVSRVMLPGYYELRIDIEDLPGAVYFATLRQGKEMAVRKLIVVK